MTEQPLPPPPEPTPEPKPNRTLRRLALAGGLALWTAFMVAIGVDVGVTVGPPRTVPTAASTPIASTATTRATTSSTVPPTTVATTAPPKVLRDGTFVVGTDVEPGTYRASSSGGCYWARLANFTGKGDVIANAFVSSGPAIVTVEASDVGFKSQGCGRWERIG
jgi:hypothetical protein